MNSSFIVVRSLTRWGVERTIQSFLQAEFESRNSEASWRCAFMAKTVLPARPFLGIGKHVFKEKPG